MTTRPAPRLAASADAIARLAGAAGVRPSLRVAEAAALLGADKSTIYEMVRTGALEGHKLGTRGVRVYADSLAQYQQEQALGAAKQGRAKPAKTSAKPPAGHAEALASLREAGLL